MTVNAVRHVKPMDQFRKWFAVHCSIQSDMVCLNKDTPRISTSIFLKKNVPIIDPGNLKVSGPQNWYYLNTGHRLSRFRNGILYMKLKIVY